MQKDEWNIWFNLFKKRVIELLGYKIYEPEDSFDFVYKLDR